MTDKEKKVSETKVSEGKDQSHEKKGAELQASSHTGQADGKSGSAGAKRGQRPKRQSRRPNKSNDPANMNTELEERVVAVNRCAKVVKGGRRFSFSVLTIVGDKRGRVGHGLGKAKEVPEAIRKAKMMAQKNMIQVPIDNGTIPHEVKSEFCAARIIFKPACDGTGVKAAGACRSILELAGITNILTKSLKSNNSHNIVKATFKALKQLRSVDVVAQARGKEAKRIRV